MRKKILAVITALIVIISCFSVVGFLVHINENYGVIKSTNQCRENIQEVQNEYVEKLYQKIVSENTNKSLAENLDYYNEILSDCKNIRDKEEAIDNIVLDNKLNDLNMKNYLADTKTFLASVEKVYRLLREGAEGNFENLNKIRDEEEEIYVENIRSNYDALKNDYKKLKLGN